MRSRRFILNGVLSIILHGVFAMLCFFQETIPFLDSERTTQSQTTITANLLPAAQKNDLSNSISNSITQPQNTVTEPPATPVSIIEPKNLISVLPPIPYYFSSRELSVKPQILQNMPADAAFIFPDVDQHTAVLTLFINEQGSVDDVAFENQDLPGPVQHFVISQFKAVRFVPGRVENEAVKSKMRVEITLHTENSDQIPLNQFLKQ